jgi:hypothetical protein
MNRKGSIDKQPRSSRPSVFSGPVVMQGFLDKKSSGAVARYQRRFFVLGGHYLKYYEVAPTPLLARPPPFFRLNSRLRLLRTTSTRTPTIR